MLVKLLSFVAFGASCVLASATPTVPASLNPPASVLVSSYHPVSQIAARGLSNAKRLASGLPLKPPSRRRRPFVARAQPSGVVLTQGYILAKDGDGNPVGYVNKAQNAYGEYVVDTDDTDPNDRLIVAIYLADAPSGTANIQTINGPDADLPFFGGIVGYASTSNDFNPLSFNYAFVGGTAPTPPNSPAISGSNTYSKRTNDQKAFESAIWTLDGNTYQLTPQWINSDGSSPTTYLGLSNGIVTLTGDIDAFVNSFGPANWVTFYFVPGSAPA
ncbi:hypothetical protein DXG03_004376 [Asterophora parasitica]|uniref:Uncharacterized protein n=1 Tax=Asterophora parasitica TaxID=117018 RepID=A0A9P7GFP5_9AGAR|nr:hypothetical protein DXG03_004376 [Asterophora parasitica]